MAEFKSLWEHTKLVKESQPGLNTENRAATAKYIQRLKEYKSERHVKPTNR